MIKVLNIISDTNIGGAGSLLIYFLTAYDRAKFEVSVALPRGGMLKEKIESLGVRVYELDCIRDKSFDIPAIKHLRRLIREADPDIVHTHGALSGRIAAKRCKKPVVFTRHSGFESNPIYTKGPGKAFFKLITKRYTDRIIATSVLSRDDLVNCGISGSLIDVILNGAPPLPKLGSGERAAARREYGFGPNDFLAGIIARIEPYKGQMFVIEAARILKDGGKKIKILVAGTGSDETAAKKRAEELDLGDTVIFLGFVQDVAPLFNMLDISINASYVETTCLSLLEGMSIGLPAVASDESGNPWVIKDGVNGLLFKSRDPASLAEQISRIHDSPELLESLSVGALGVYSSEFTCERFAENTQSVYLKVLEDHYGRQSYT